MSKFTAPHYLPSDQYRDASKLGARVEIHKQFGANPYGWFHKELTAILEKEGGIFITKDSGLLTGAK